MASNSVKDHPRPFVTVDCVVLTLKDDKLQMLLVQRQAAPQQGVWTLPGGFVHVEEDADAEAAAHRVLKQKAKLDVRHLEQLATFSGAKRDSRGWSVSIAYLAIVRCPQGPVDPGRWVDVQEHGALPFDHAQIVEAALKRVRDKSSYSSLPALLLEKVFTLPQLQAVYEKVLDTRLDAASFRRKVLAQDLIVPVKGSIETVGAGRPAQLYRLRFSQLQDFGRVVMLPDNRRGG